MTRLSIWPCVCNILGSFDEITLNEGDWVKLTREDKEVNLHYKNFSEYTSKHIKMKGYWDKWMEFRRLPEYQKEATKCKDRYFELKLEVWKLSELYFGETTCGYFEDLWS